LICVKLWACKICNYSASAPFLLKIGKNFNIDY
jgi:hypothetical protein